MSKYTKVILTEYELKKLKSQIATQTTSKVLLLVTSYLMEEPEVNFNEDRIIDLWDGVSRYAEAIDQHLITLNQVAGIIKDHTGLDVKWND